MRRPLVLTTIIAIAVSAATVAPEAQAWTQTCNSVIACEGVKSACRMVGGSYGGYVDPWDFKVWGICVVPDKAQ